MGIPSLSARRDAGYGGEQEGGRTGRQLLLGGLCQAGGGQLGAQRMQWM